MGSRMHGEHCYCKCPALTAATICAAGWLLSCGLNARTLGETQQAARPPHRVHLMLEEELVARQQGLRRVGHPAVKAAQQPVMTADTPSEGEGVVFACVRQVDGQFRMWYQSLHAKPEGRLDLFTHYATSVDGMKWKKPELGLHEFAGSTRNNQVLSDRPTLLEIPSVIIADDLPPDRRFTMFANTPGRGNHLGAFHSADGIHWTPFPGNPIENQIHTSDQVYVTWDPWQSRYLCFCKEDFRITDPQTTSRLVAPWGRVQRLMECSDRERLRPWQAIGPGELGEQFGRADEEWPMHQYYGAVPICYEGNYLASLAVYHSIPDDDGIDCEWVYSRDGELWRKTSHRTRVVERGPNNAWDFVSAFVTSCVPVDDEIWIFYSGGRSRHGPPQATAQRPPDYLRRSIGLAKLRRDGFASMQPVEQTGWLETVAVPCAGRKLLVNTDAGDGWCRVELLDHQGRVIPGYSEGECLPITVDGPEVRAEWKSGTELPDLSDKPIKVRFILSNARLYSFRFDD